MTITKFLDEDKKVEVLLGAKNKEIFKFIQDERLLRVLFEDRIFELRDIQKEAIRQGLFFRKSFLVCAPSGSGKTLIGELCAMYNIFQKFGKSVYLVPFKALAVEKYFHFKKTYTRFKVKVELSIGDYEIDDERLEKADLIITTFEKMDSILRNFFNKDWIANITTIIIDEIHSISESERGPRIESLIVRLNEFLHNPQLIGLSATIANAEFFNAWLNSLGNKSILIKSEVRPVPLKYMIEIAPNKDAQIKKVVKKTLSEKGQVLIFLNKRKTAQEEAENLKKTVGYFVEGADTAACRELEKKIKKIKGYNTELGGLVKYGIAFHHAGLLPKERILIEEQYRKRVLKVICCTTTLSAGVNMPARVVILKDFKKFVTSGYSITNFAGLFENGDGFSYFKPFSANEVFQTLGRAGRPGLDSIGYGVILVKDVEERMWVEEHYFHNTLGGGAMIPKYNDLVSGLNNLNTLKEQVLLRIYEEKEITLEQLKIFFERTYFWYNIKEKMKKEKIPIEQLLMIKEMDTTNALKLHSQPHKVEQLKKKNYPIKIAKLTDAELQGYVKTDFGVFNCRFEINTGITCSCGFKNGISDNFAVLSQQQFSFDFCDHITCFLLYLEEFPDTTLKKYINDIVPKSLRNQYILNYLLEKGLIARDNNGKIKCTNFGALIIKLYLYPVSGVLIRQKLEQNEICSMRDLMKEAYEILQAEGKVKDQKMLNPLLAWTDEEPLEQIIEEYHIMAGDLFTVRDHLVRVVTFIGIIANYLSSGAFERKEQIQLVSEICETLRIRIQHGIREELFDLVLRVENVGRVRARLLYNAGYHTAAQIANERPFILSKKIGLGVNLSKKIIEASKTIKVKAKEKKS